jgi:hypothetical protein
MLCCFYVVTLVKFTVGHMGWLTWWVKYLLLALVLLDSCVQIGLWSKRHQGGSPSLNVFSCEVVWWSVVIKYRWINERSDLCNMHHRNAFSSDFITCWFLWSCYNGLLPSPQAEGLPHVGCPLLLIWYIRICPPYPEAVYSVCNLMTCRAMATWWR